MARLLLFTIAVMLFITSCSSPKDKQLKISATTWVGYTPLLYAKEKGWLKPLHIKLMHVSSLAENMYLYKAGNADAYVGTQYEYNVLIKERKSLMPVMMFDRSFGGDLIVANRSLEALKKESGTIDVYLEIDSINHTIYQDFAKHYGLENQKVRFHNFDQAYISTLKSSKLTNPTVIVTYVPYDALLKREGFKEIVSTKDGLQLLVVDALFTTHEIFNAHKEQFTALKKLVDKAVNVVKKDPKEFYDTVKHYMLEINYEEFKHSLGDIIWINERISDELMQRIHEAGFPTRDLL